MFGGPNVKMDLTDEAQVLVDAWHKECQSRHFAMPDPPKLVIDRIEPSAWHLEEYEFIVYLKPAEQN